MTGLMNVASFFAVATITVLVPVLGYKVTNPKAFVYSLHLLVALIGSDFLYSYVYYRRSADSLSADRTLVDLVLLLQAVILVISLWQFISGLRSLERNGIRPLEAREINLANSLDAANHSEKSELAP